MKREGDSLDYHLLYYREDFHMHEGEKALLDRVRSGDVEAFEQLIEGYQKKVYNIALRMIGNHDDASELAQEVFIRVYKSISSFKEESQLSTWIYRITSNACLDELRRRKNKRVVSIDENIKYEDSEFKRELEDDKPTPDILAEKNEIRKAIKDAIRALPEHHRMMIVMRDIQGLSYEEIAQSLQSPEGTIKSRINRARQALKEILLKKKELLGEEFVK
jgi:RNA polymerase sigma-70 factor (ECF subfamily)